MNYKNKLQNGNWLLTRVPIAIALAVALTIIEKACIR